MFKLSSAKCLDKVKFRKVNCIIGNCANSYTGNKSKRFVVAGTDMVKKLAGILEWCKASEVVNGAY